MRVLLFSIDILPYQGRVQTSGGSLRSQQFVDQFAAAGFEVVKAVPKDALLVKTQRNFLDSGDFLYFDVGNEAEIIAQVKPDIVVWSWPLIAQVPITPAVDVTSVVDLNGFQNIESATATGDSLAKITKAVLHRARNADFVVYGSHEQRAYWEGLFQLEFQQEPPTRAAVLPFYGTYTKERPYDGGAVDFYYVGSVLPWLSPFKALTCLARELKHFPKSKLRIFTSTQPAVGPGNASGELMRLAEHPSVTLEQPLPASALYDRIGYSGIAFDVLEESFERRFAYPIRTVCHLAHGMPIIHNDFSSLSRGIRAVGAGWTTALDDKSICAAVGAALADTEAQLATRSRASVKLAKSLFACPENWTSFFAQVRDVAKGRRANQPLPSHRKKKLSVLVVSDDADNLLTLRMIAPLEALLRDDKIASYVVAGKDGVRRSSSGAGNAIDTVLVQRVPQVLSSVILNSTNGRFIYDIDDNLLSHPVYRPPFPPDFWRKVTTLLDGASTVTVTNQFIARSLAIRSGIDVSGKARILPNPLLRRPVDIKDRPIKKLLFSSSDELPLLDSAAEVFRAIGGFCRARGLEFIYVGSYPENQVFRDYLRGIPTTVLQPRAYAEYLELVENIDALALVPLETRSSGATQQFVDSKSDIKAVEYLGMGRPAVFSDAVPYRYSDLPLRHVIPNEKIAWDAALGAAMGQTLAERREGAELVTQKRWIGGPIKSRWLDVFEQNTLAKPLDLAHFVADNSSVLGSMSFPVWPATQFDEAFYLDNNLDVRKQIQSGGFKSAYQHYVEFGRSEGRAASCFDTGRSLADHIEEAISVLIGVDDALNATDRRIAALKQTVGGLS